MTNKINLKICVGTMCYVMGGAELKDAVETLPSEMLEYLNITYSPCLGCGDGLRPPFIEINGKKIAGVSKNNLIQIVIEEIRDAV